MATVTKGRTFVSGEVVTPTKLNTLVDSATVTQIVDADISSSAAIADTKLATISTAGKVANSATTATSANTASAIVARDASGNFSAATITATAVSATTISGSAGTFLVPTGAVMAFTMNAAPSGWLAANGAAVSRATYSALFALLGVTYGGGDGINTFNLPDLRGYFVRGAGTNADGTTSGTFGAKQADAFQGHRHSNSQNAIAGGGGTTTYAGPGPGLLQSATISVLDPITDGTNGTPRTAIETRPANIAMLYCIKT